jgi:hypothetical protein
LSAAAFKYGCICKLSCFDTKNNETLDQGGKAMKRYLSVLAFIWVGLALSACGGVHSVVTKPPSGIDGIKAVTLARVEVTSHEQHDDAISLNLQWEKLARDELQSLFASKKISTSPDSPAIVMCRIHVIYGSRAARYWAGFGAGKGTITVTVELKDKSGNVQYATESKAELSVGAFGGDMADVARNTIQAAVKEFGSRL